MVFYILSHKGFIAVNFFVRRDLTCVLVHFKDKTYRTYAKVKF